MIIDGVLFLNNDGREGKALGKKHLRPGNIDGHPYLFHFGVKVDNVAYVLMTSNVRERDNDEGSRHMVRTAIDAYDWYTYGKFYFGELKNGNERRA